MIFNLTPEFSDRFRSQSLCELEMSISWTKLYIKKFGFYLLHLTCIILTNILLHYLFFLELASCWVKHFKNTLTLFSIDLTPTFVLLLGCFSPFVVTNHSLSSTVFSPTSLPLKTVSCYDNNSFHIYVRFLCVFQCITIHWCNLHFTLTIAFLGMNKADNQLVGPSRYPFPVICVHFTSGSSIVIEIQSHPGSCN